MEKGIRKILTFEIRLIVFKIYFLENETEAAIISKRLKFPWDDRKDTKFIAPLGMHV